MCTEHKMAAKASKVHFKDLVNFCFSNANHTLEDFKKKRFSHLDKLSVVTELWFNIKFVMFNACTNNISFDAFLL